jgi:hypothetical protein
MDQRKISYIVAFILFIIGTFFAIRGHAYEYESFNKRTVLHPSQAREYRQKKSFHQAQGIEAYERAHEKFWWLPRISDRALARSCYTSAMTTITATTPQSKIVAVIVSTMITYGLAAMDEWDYINYNLADAQHHFELMEFYNDVLNKA